MANQYVNKVDVNGQTLIDLTADTVTADKLAEGITAHDKSGAIITGTMTSGTPIPGPLRPDAELVQEWVMDSRLKADLNITIPSYSTSAATLKNFGSVGTVATDVSSYYYIVTVQASAIPIYSNSTAAKGRFDKTVFVGTSELAYTISNWFDTSLGASATIVSQSAAGQIYYTSATAQSRTTSNYGLYHTNVACTYTSGSLTVNAPTLMIRGNTTYFTSAQWAYMTDIQYKRRIAVYRVPRSTVAGFELTSLYRDMNVRFFS